MTDVAASRATRLTDRWPAAVGIVVAAAAIGLMVLVDNEAELFGPSVAVLAGIYMLTYVIGRPWSAWLALPVMSTVMAVLQVLHFMDLSWADPFIGMVVVVALLWLATIAQRRFSDVDLFSLQTSGLVVFGIITLVCAAVAPRLGAAMAGVGFLAHGLWDGYHFRTHKVVHRTYAEFCGVVDIPTGIALIVVALL